MKQAVRTTVSTFGFLAGIAGIEHGIGGLLQGSVHPCGVMILSWPDSHFFAMVNGEPAMTLIPNLLFSGLLAILFSALFMLWALLFVPRRHSGPIMLLLSLVMLLVGAGFGPPLLGIILAATTARSQAVSSRQPGQPAGMQRRLPPAAWRWLYGISLAFWLMLFPGIGLLSVFFGFNNSDLVAVVVLVAFVSLFLTITAAFLIDEQPAGWSEQTLESARCTA